MSEFTAAPPGAPGPDRAARRGAATPIAVIGMAGRFPGATGIAEFWNNIVNGVESVRELSPAELRAAGLDETAVADPARVAVAADLADADLFDARFFGITARDAALTDPQHRLLLTCAWEAMEDAGLVPGRTGGRTGVYAAGSISTYLLSQVLQSSAHTGEELTYPALLGNDKDFLATRVSYRLDLTGPSMSVGTACSGSLTALHLACAALDRGECETALVGGVSITFPQTAGHLHQEGGILSQEGHCRPFDARSDGTVKGNGCGVVVLKPLADALADGDRVYAVVRGTAANNDGSDKIGYTAPGPAGQQAVVRQALAASGVPADTIGYVETHGTGTALGDPLELRALAAAHRAADGPAPGCAIGSVKANIGHLDAAAGVAGLIKTALALHHGVVPPLVGYESPNPHLGLASLPYDVPTGEAVRRPLRAAAVSSFGIGGTNVHCVLEAPPEQAPSVRPDPGTPLPVVLSALDQEDLRDVARALRAHLDEAEPALPDLARTLFAGRRAMPARHAFTASSTADVRAGLDAFLGTGPALPAGEGAGEAEKAVRAWNGGEEPGAWAFGPARTVSLPAYPFRRTRHWIEADRPATGDAVAAGPEPVRGPDEIRAQVIALLEQRLGVAGITPEDDFFELGGDSLLAVEIGSVMRKSLGGDFDFERFAGLSVIGEMTEYAVATAAPLPSAPAAPRVQDLAAPAVPAGTPVGRVLRVREGEGRTLFLVHPAGGTNFVYFRLALHSGTSRPLAAASFPDREAGRPDTLRELAALYVAQVRAEQPHGPYLLGGYSFGGNVLFEMALQLRAAGEEVGPLLMIDSHPPEAYVGGHVTETEFDAAVPLLLESATENEEQAELLVKEGFVDAWRHNHDLLKGYYPDRRFDGDAVLILARDEEDGALLDTMRIRRADKVRSWGVHIAGRIEVLTTPGDHFTIFEEGTRLKELAVVFDAALDRLAETAAAKDGTHA
ncbi:beta-ketoacyl synthase N-terminal-like domain-containing protein [Streptomyces sp. NPDC007346]|uniref:beta-ketoacyl synthase N-terminal-like domain-containing protein n=1 Tax=Streptomyces sp. NPDC007346 TaxID=3154682 RepID=UPI003451732E